MKALRATNFLSSIQSTFKLTTLSSPYLFYHVGSFVTHCGFLETWILESPSGSRWASRCRAGLSVALRHAAPLDDRESGVAEQSAVGTPCLQQCQTRVSGSRDLWSSCCRSPYNLCTRLHRRNLQEGKAGREKINDLETENQKLYVNTVVTGVCCNYF